LQVVTGNDDFVVEGVRFTPELLNGSIDLQSGADLTVTVQYTASRDFPDVDVNTILSVPGRFDRHIFQRRNPTINKKIDFKRGKGAIDITLKNVNLNNYRVYLQFSISFEKKTLFFWKQIPVYVEGDASSNAFLSLDMDYEVQSYG